MFAFRGKKCLLHEIQKDIYLNNIHLVLKQRFQAC
jgi:hypothetical protein